MLDPAAGSVIADKYVLEKKLGQGGMGSVWRAQHLTLKAPVAVKLIDPSIANNPDALMRFNREAQAAAALRSPHVVQTFDHGVADGIPYIAMEMLEGESLADRLERQRVVPPADLARIITHVARAVGKGHEAGIVHRDLKPDNIFICLNDDEEVAKVLDFGIAKATEGSLSMSSNPATRTGAMLGTPYYMSPEQAAGNRSIDYRSDLWSMGVIAFECLLGRRPFQSDGLGDLLMQICAAPLPVPSMLGPVPPGFDDWWARAAARDPNQRFGSAKELAESLKQVLVGGRPTMSSVVEGGTAGYGVAHAATPHGYGPHAATPHPGTPNTPFNQTTGQLGVAEVPAGVPTKGSGGLVLAVVGGVGLLLLLGGGGLWFAMRGDDGVAGAEPAAAQSAKPTELEPEATSEEAESESTKAPLLEMEDDAGAEKPAPPLVAPAAATAPTAALPTARPTPKPTAAPAPRPPPAPAPAPTKKKPDLGF